MEAKCIKKRNSNIEWLRITAMFMVVMLHALGKGELLQSINGHDNINYVLAGILESFSVVAVNLYVLISGYVLIDSKFKSGRLFEIISETCFYGILFLVIGWRFSLFENLGLYEIIQCVLPIHSETYWFITTYVLLYLLTPFMAKGIMSMTGKQHLSVIILLVIYESCFKTFLPVAFEGDEKGYNLIWFIILFLIAAYIKKYNHLIKNKYKSGIIVYFLASVLIFAEYFFIDYLYVNFDRFELLRSVSFHYNHILVLISSIGLFVFFVYRPQKDNLLSKIGLFLAPMSFGVYIIHEHIAFRYKWMRWFNCENFIYMNPFLFLISVILMCALVYVVCSLIDYVRIQLFRLIKYFFRNSIITKGFHKLDSIVNGAE